MFFRDEGQGSFRKMMPRDVGPILPGTSSNTEDNVQGAGWADYDRDGFLDVYVSLSGMGTDWLFRNLGDGTFAKISSSQTGSRRTERTATESRGEISTMTAGLICSSLS